jgi:integrase/recombinase XerD
MSGYRRFKILVASMPLGFGILTSVIHVMELMEYMHSTRKELLALTGKDTDKLFISIGSGKELHNLMQVLMEGLHVINPRVTSLQQLRASVIVHWLKLYNLREVQYMAGHRYVSSTESFNECNGRADQ